MRYAKILALALALALTLAACVDRADHEGPSAWLQPVGNLPPPLFQDCVDLVLLDNQCVRQWYGCVRGAADRGPCADAWQECCSLPGRGKRSNLASVRPVDR